jgi:hypothetical protein
MTVTDARAELSVLLPALRNPELWAIGDEPEQLLPNQILAVYAHQTGDSCGGIATTLAVRCALVLVRCHEFPTLADWIWSNREHVRNFVTTGATSTMAYDTRRLALILSGIANGWVEQGDPEEIASLLSEGNVAIATNIAVDGTLPRTGIIDDSHEFDWEKNGTDPPLQTHAMVGVAWMWRRGEFWIVLQQGDLEHQFVAFHWRRFRGVGGQLLWCDGVPVIPKGIPTQTIKDSDRGRLLEGRGARPTRGPGDTAGTTTRTAPAGAGVMCGSRERLMLVGSPVTSKDGDLL